MFTGGINLVDEVDQFFHRVFCYCDLLAKKRLQRGDKIYKSASSTALCKLCWLDSNPFQFFRQQGGSSPKVNLNIILLTAIFSWTDGWKISVPFWNSSFSKSLNTSWTILLKWSRSLKTVSWIALKAHLFLWTWIGQYSPKAMLNFWTPSTFIMKSEGRLEYCRWRCNNASLTTFSLFNTTASLEPNLTENTSP